MELFCIKLTARLTKCLVKCVYECTKSIIVLKSSDASEAGAAPGLIPHSCLNNFYGLNILSSMYESLPASTECNPCFVQRSMSFQVSQRNDVLMSGNFLCHRHLLTTLETLLISPNKQQSNSFKFKK